MITTEVKPEIQMSNLETAPGTGMPSGRHMGRPIKRPLVPNNKPGRLWCLAIVLGFHLAILYLFVMLPGPTPLHPKTDEPKPLHMVMVEPINAPLVAPSGSSLQPTEQPQSRPEEKTPTPVHPVTQATPKPVQTPAPTMRPSPIPVAGPSVNTPSPAATSSPVAAANTGGEHAITLPNAASGGQNAGPVKAAPSGESTPSVPAASSSATGNSSSPPRFGVAYLNNPAPKYPSSARRMGEEGKVMLRVLVSADGLAKQVLLRASSGSTTLDDSAMAAVRKWRFIPAKLNGDTVEAWVQVPIVFKLDN